MWFGLVFFIEVQRLVSSTDFTKFAYVLTWLLPMADGIESQMAEHHRPAPSSVIWGDWNLGEFLSLVLCQKKSLLYTSGVGVSGLSKAS